MKKLFALLTAMLLMALPALAETTDLTQLSAQELLALIEQAKAELVQKEEEELIFQAAKTMIAWWVEKYQKDGYYTGEGYLEIVHTQVIYIQDAINVDPNFEKAASLFDGVACIVEFVVLDDLYGSAPYYYPAYGVFSVRVMQDGTMEPYSASLFNRYRGVTYNPDFSGIIESISDRNTEFNNTWYLLK